MSQETKILGGVGLLTILIIGVGIFLTGNSGSNRPTSAKPVDKKILVKKQNHRKGPENAKVQVVEFADFQCPACAKAHPVLKQMLDEYEGKVSLTYRHFPLSQHQYAMLASYVSEAAGEQGKFWEMYDKLYGGQGEWEKSSEAYGVFKRYARELKLNMKQFEEAVKNQKYHENIVQDRNDGNTIGIQYTPTLFINGKILEGAPSYEALKKEIDVILSK